jgi:hypothetical protein
MPLLDEAKKLLAIMDELPAEPGGQQDRVFAEFEFDGLRAAVAEAEANGWTKAEKRRLLISVLLFACSLGATWYQWRGSEHLREIIGRQQSVVWSQHAEIEELRKERGLLIHDRMSKEPKITGIARVKLWKDRKPERLIWEATIDQGDGRMQFAELVGDAKVSLDFFEQMIKDRK